MVECPNLSIFTQHGRHFVCYHRSTEGLKKREKLTALKNAHIYLLYLALSNSFLFVRLMYVRCVIIIDKSPMLSLLHHMQP